MLNPFGLNPVKVEKFYAYTRKEKYYGKALVEFNYVPYKVGDWIDIDTDDFKLRGSIERINGKMVLIKMEEIAHKGEPN